ncbi:hypothetical protein HY641_04220 [Candidatus Woesearchaeota archaeon]|nr:hypothetical protein [Candidatus Woesearchaeota archaeon]
MEDIEKLKKIAKLSAELKRHGFAASSDEAIKQSEAIFQERILAPHGMTEAAPKSQTPPTTGGTPMDQKTQDQMNEMKETLNNVVAKMNEMIKAINDLEVGHKALAVKVSSGGVASRPTPEPQRFSNEPARDDGSRTIQPKPEKGSEANQRAGNYTPQDVDIGKIFYYGNKK